MPCDTVSAHGAQAAPAHHAQAGGPVGVLDQYPVAEAGHHHTGLLVRLRQGAGVVPRPRGQRLFLNASTLAAQMKSLSDSPPMVWVE